MSIQESEHAPAAAGAEGVPAEKLRDVPNLMYLLREFETLYRHGSAGGSTAIRSHRRRVREALKAALSANPPLNALPREDKPVTAHLPRALDLGERGAMEPMALALRRVQSRLSWVYGYDRLPKSLAQKYAYCDVLGPTGLVFSERLVLGFVLFAPSTTYPQHVHEEIEESYISIAGAWSENNDAVYAPGSLILNRSNHAHRITTGENDPCLLAYAWVGPAERLAAPGMKLSRPRKSRD